MRRLFTTAESGLTSNVLRWGEQTGRWRRIQKGVYGEGAGAITPLDRERARVLASGSAARGGLAGVMHGLDSVELDGQPTRRDPLPPERVVVIDGTPCADALQTLVDLAAHVDDDTWEQALESALRKRLVTTGAFDAVAPHTKGIRRIRRVLARRPVGAPPTESLLETLMVQVARTVPGLGEPTRQYVVRWDDGTFVARVDLCRPELGLFRRLGWSEHRSVSTVVRRALTKRDEAQTAPHRDNGQTHSATSRAV